MKFTISNPALYVLIANASEANIERYSAYIDLVRFNESVPGWLQSDSCDAIIAKYGVVEPRRPSLLRRAINALKGFFADLHRAAEMHERAEQAFVLNRRVNGQDGGEGY